MVCGFLGVPETLSWGPVRSKLKSKKLFASYACTVELSRSYIICEINRLNEKQVNASSCPPFIMLDIKEICKATFLTKFILFWEIVIFHKNIYVDMYMGLLLHFKIS